MSLRRSLAIQLLALSVLTDAFAVKRTQDTVRIQSGDTGQDQAPAGSAAQHITKIPRHKAKVSSKITAKPPETTTVENSDVITQEPAVNTNEIEDRTSIKSSQDAHGPGTDAARTDIASNGTNDAIANTNVTEETTVEPTPVSVTNNVTAGNKVKEDPNWVPESVTEVNTHITDTTTTTVTITTVDNVKNYSTASVNDNVDEGAIEPRINSAETQRPIGKIASENVSETNNSVSALVAEYTKANTKHELTTEKSFVPPTQNATEDKDSSNLQDELIESKNVEESKDTTLELRNDTDMPNLTTAISSDSYSQSLSNDWRRSSEIFEELTEPKTTEDYSKYNKVISKAERTFTSLGTNYGDKLDVTTGINYVTVKKADNEGPLDDVTMDTSDSWRREDTAVVTSMRGGYLNHAPDQVKKEPVKNDAIQMDEDNETIPKQSTQTIESQSLMVEDKIKDELLKEDRQTEYEQAQPHAQPSRSDEGLNVKPIATGKNHSLYTVSANYKPMKKLDVVPGKPQLRDPDDNSWRNQSLNNLGIVFKGKNSTKAFTQVLKNKTETELSSLVERDNTTEAPELRERLEKLAEERKSKKKKTDKSGEVVDYDNPPSYFYRTTTDKGLSSPARVPSTARERLQSADRELTSPFNNIFKTYDYENSDDDVEYVTLPFLDLQKSAVTKTSTSGTTRSPTTKSWAQPTTKQLLDRKPTVQYFPPRAPPSSKVYVKNDTKEDEFQRKMKEFEPEHNVPVTTAYYVLKEPELTTKAARTNVYIPDTLRPELAEEYRVPADKAYSFRDLMTRIGHEDDYDRVNEYIPSHRVKEAVTQRENPVRKEVIEKFMQNYNDNSKKFKVDYPVVYKSRVFHTDGSVVEPASSSASFQRQYRDRQRERDRDPDCDKMLELSADYELHYYVPEQEERLEIDKIVR